MRKFLIYKDAVKLLNDKGITSRVKNISSFDLDISSYSRQAQKNALNRLFSEFKDAGYSKGIDADVKDLFVDPFLEVYKRVMDGSDHDNWEFGFEGQENIQKATLADMVLLGGFAATRVLEPSEIWDLEGFDSYSEKFGLIGAAMFDKTFTHSTISTYEKNSRSMELKLERGLDGDLEIVKSDITEYTSIDPVGFEVRYRPLEVEENVYSYQTDEGQTRIMFDESANQATFAMFLKYALQKDIPVDVRNKNYFDQYDLSAGLCQTHWTKSIIREANSKFDEDADDYADDILPGKGRKVFVDIHPELDSLRLNYGFNSLVFDSNEVNHVLNMLVDYSPQFAGVYKEIVDDMTANFEN